MRCRHFHHDEELEFQIAPMVDVLLVILVFFVLITSASVLRLTSNVELPVAANSAEMTKTPTETMINAMWDRKTATGRASIFHPVTGLEVNFTDLDELAKFLKPWVKSEQFRAILRADRFTPASYIQKIVGACAEAGINDITFSAVNTAK